MGDPLPPTPAFLQHMIEPLATRLGLRTLPKHIHEVLLAFTLYLFLEYAIVGRLSTWLAPSVYPHLPQRRKLDWNIRVVSLFQSILICCVAFWIIYTDTDRRLMNAEQRIWGYNGATGMTQAFAAGYFVWDVLISTRYLNMQGWGSLAHAISALIIVSLGFVSLTSLRWTG